MHEKQHIHVARPPANHFRCLCGQLMNHIGSAELIIAVLIGHVMITYLPVVTDIPKCYPDNRILCLHYLHGQIYQYK